MTHIEPFHYPVWDVEALQRVLTEASDVEETADGNQPKSAKYYVLFDYAQRNPLTYEARTQVLEG